MPHMRLSDRLRSIEYLLRFYLIKKQIKFLADQIGLDVGEMDRLKAVGVAALIFEGRLIKDRHGKFLSEHLPEEYGQFKIDADPMKFLKSERIKDYLRK